jgi:putative hydrolase
MNDPFDLPPDILRRIPLFAELSKVLSWRGGPVNWDLARQVATSVAQAEEQGRRVTEAEKAEMEEHVRVAEMWVEELASLPVAHSVLAARAATAGEWVEAATVPFSELIDPVAAKAARALTSQAGEGLEDMMSQAMGQIAPMFMGVQAGTVLGTLARDVTGTHETGLPVGEEPMLLVLPAIDRIATEYQIESRRVRQWVALRAVAMRSLTEGFPGARATFFARYLDFVASLDVDLADGIRKLQDLDLTDPARLQEALRDEGLLNLTPSPATAAAAEGVARYIALVGAHADAATSAANDRIGDGDRVGEAFARRAVDTKGIEMLYGFIGLEPPSGALRRSASSFVRAVISSGGFALANRVWEDAESFPAAGELDEPDAWLRRNAA